MQIVYARAEQTKLVETGRFITKDRNLFPEFRAEWQGSAGMWLCKGTASDIIKAKQSLEPEGYTILTFDSSERDPLGKAKAAVVAAKL